MISPVVDPTTPFSDGALRRRTQEFFRAGGALAQAAADEGHAWEHRPQQETMAVAVAEALENHRHLAVEAGTGVGKSFAYLVPMILGAVARQSPAVVSTYTISLQEQLIHKDIPFLRQHLGLDFKAVLVKGKGNYLCLRRLARAELMARDLFPTAEAAALKKIRAWAAATTDGSIQDLREPPPPGVWSAVCVEEGNCLGAKCPVFSSCFFMRARREMADAHLLVVNHHLLFADLALRIEESGFLPDFDALVLDEAHEVEDVAAEHLGIRLTHNSVEFWLRRLYSPDTDKGLLVALRHTDLARAVTGLWAEADRFFEGVRAATGLRDDAPQRTVERPVEVDTAFLDRLGELIPRLEEAAVSTEDADAKAELQQARRRGREIVETIRAFLDRAMPDHVYWVEAAGRRRRVALQSAPVDVRELLADHLFGAVPCIVMTSATLAVNGTLDYFRRRIGAEESDALQVGSPFDYARQMKVYLANGLPEPTDTENFVPAIARSVLHFAGLTRGAAFVLFTNLSLMRRVAEAVRGDLLRLGLTLLVQGENLPRHLMLEEFRKGRGMVLFGLDSFWMGVDVRGDALRNVIITRLPFAVPDQPLVKARMDRIVEQGGDAFRDYSLPEAIIKFRQGVGRLIRTATDTGIVVVLDRRIAQKWYGRWFLQSIPEVPVERADVPGLGSDQPAEEPPW